jgi:predicted phosphatase
MVKFFQAPDGVTLEKTINEWEQQSGNIITSASINVMGVGAYSLVSYTPIAKFKVEVSKPSPPKKRVTPKRK